MLSKNRFPIIKLSEPVSILMPVSNEADVIEEVVEEWVRDVVSHLPRGSEFLFDEAASNDGTREILQRLIIKYPFINVEYQDKKDGFAKAARRLYGRAKCPWVFFTDSDGQYVLSYWLSPKVYSFHISALNALQAKLDGSLLFEYHVSSALASTYLNGNTCLKF